MNLRVMLPPLPDKTHPNARPGNWAVKARHIQEQRSQARVAALAAMNRCGAPYKPQWVRAAISVELHNHSTRAKRMDPDNLIAWAKASIDGFADAGVIATDRELTWLPPKQFIGPYEASETMFVITIEGTGNA